MACHTSVASWSSSFPTGSEGIWSKSWFIILFKTCIPFNRDVCTFCILTSWDRTEGLKLSHTAWWTRTFVKFSQFPGRWYLVHLVLEFFLRQSIFYQCFDNACKSSFKLLRTSRSPPWGLTFPHKRKCCTVQATVPQKQHQEFSCFCPLLLCGGSSTSCSWSDCRKLSSLSPYVSSISFQCLKSLWIGISHITRELSKSILILHPRWWTVGRWSANVQGFC